MRDRWGRSLVDLITTIQELTALTQNGLSSEVVVGQFPSGRVQSWA
jgi:hypothetical protein